MGRNTAGTRTGRSMTARPFLSLTSSAWPGVKKVSGENRWAQRVCLCPSRLASTANRNSLMSSAMRRGLPFLASIANDVSPASG